MSAADLLATRQWAIQPEWLRAMEVIAERPRGEKANIEAVADALGQPIDVVQARLGRPLDQTERTTVREGVAIVPVTGPIFPRANLFTEFSGGTSVDMLALDFRAALDDPKVRAVVLSIDSPGGEITGIAEFATHVFEARREQGGSKPVVAYIGGAGASGAYWIAAAAESVVAGPTAMLGSIGVVTTITDDRKRIEGAGYRRTVLVSRQSPLKRPDVETEGGREALQKVVDDLAERFVSAVAAYRGVSLDTVLADFGQGSVLVDRDAVAVGMADSTDTLENLIAGLAAKGSAYAAPTRTVAAAQPEKEHMTDKPHVPAALSADQIRKDHPVAAREIETAAATAGATAERERILGLEALARPGHEKLVAEAKADGKTTASDLALRIVQAEQEAAGKRLAAERADAPQVPATPRTEPAAALPADGAAMAAEITRIRAEAKAKGEEIDVVEAARRIRLARAAA